MEQTARYVLLALLLRPHCALVKERVCNTSVNLIKININKLLMWRGAVKVLSLWPRLLNNTFGGAEISLVFKQGSPL